MYEAVLGKFDAVTAALCLGRESHRVLPGENPWGYSGGLQRSPSTKQEQTSLSSSIEEQETGDKASARSSLTLVEKENEKAEVGRE
ncbi:hypothetical protein DL98DRAFT_519829 [Cadophora sp. DSE1049]|nr:hypothetical protein DL98DRAFT_519829 [Cadophora sp. DSE1049]